MTKDTGGQAFPTKLYTEQGHPGGYDMGMTLRDWFAGNCRMEGTEFRDLETAASWMGIDPPPFGDAIAFLEFSFKLEAFIRYRKADAMLAARQS